MSKISSVFEQLKAKNEGALIGYITCGDPNPTQTLQIAQSLIRGGVDILELGLPFSDPIADGPTIQAASIRALNAGTTPAKVLDVAKQIRQQSSVPLVIMTYYNPVFKMGLDNFFCQAKNCLVDGIIVPDLPAEEAKDCKQAARCKGVDTIFLAAPSTGNERLRNIVACSSGFLYLVSHFGVTGAKADVSESTIELVQRVLPFTREHIALAVGFGVSKPEHVRRILAAGADGVIVGSAFINIISKNLNDHDAMQKELEATARELKTATLNP
ncbi:MAG: tryptophan synthase subunit alpha [Candidatus Bathyarchaeota archaeon]|nr:tryptophan synthase subunit alpha [Candidatus Bathyarchaeota archaeon]